MNMHPYRAIVQSANKQKGGKVDVDKNVWHVESVYIQLFSIKGCMMNIDSVFTEEAQMRENRKKMKENV